MGGFTKSPARTANPGAGGNFILYLGYIFYILLIFSVPIETAIGYKKAKTNRNWVQIHPKECPADVYNKWEDFEINTKSTPNGEGDAQPFKDLLWDFSGSEQNSYEYILKWLAYLVQYPEEKPQFGIKGKYGIALRFFLKIPIEASMKLVSGTSPYEPILGQ
ncbi:unnamed protein product [Bathycoccus prasinos]